MAAALPLSGLAAWRVHLGLPMGGSRLLAETDVPVSAVALASPGARLDFVALADEPGLEPAPQRADAAAGRRRGRRLAAPPPGASAGPLTPRQPVVRRRLGTASRRPRSVNSRRQ